MRHSIADICIKDEYAYFFDNITQALHEISLTTGIIKVLAIYGGEFFSSSNIFLNKDCLYVTSFKTIAFLKYDMNLRVLKLITKKGTTNEMHNSTFFDYHAIFDQKIWSFPNKYEEYIYYYDLNIGKYKKVGKIYDSYKYKEKSVIRFASSFENNYWAGIYKTNKYLQFDLQKQECELYEFSDPSIHIAGINDDGDYLWITLSDESSILKCTKTGKIEVEFKGNEEWNGDTFSRLFCIDQYIIALPRFGDFILFINKSKNTLKRLYLQDIDSNILVDNGSASKILKCLKYKNKVLFAGYDINALIVTDINGSNAYCIPIKYSDEDTVKLHYAEITKKVIMCEYNKLDIAEFILANVYGSSLSNIKEEKKMSINGTGIYKHIIDSLGHHGKY